MRSAGDTGNMRSAGDIELSDRPCLMMSVRNIKTKQVPKKRNKKVGHSKSQKSVDSKLLHYRVTSKESNQISMDNEYVMNDDIKVNHSDVVMSPFKQLGGNFPHVVPSIEEQAADVDKKHGQEKGGE